MSNPSKLLEETLEAARTQLDRSGDYIDAQTKPAKIPLPEVKGIDEALERIDRQLERIERRCP